MKVTNTIIENLKNGKANNLILGSGHSLGYNDNNFPDFISTDQDEIDLINRFEITQYIPKESISIILAHHVLEHIYAQEIWNVFENIHFMQKIGGYLVICVPDLLSPTSRFYKNREEAIIFQPKASHHVFFTSESLTYVLHETGYEVLPIFYHNENGKLLRNNNTLNLLESTKLKKFIQNSIRWSTYQTCIIGKKWI